MNRVFEAALEFQTFCREHDFKFCIIGGVAVQRWGEPRATLDADATLLTGFGHEEPFINAALERFRPRREDAARFAGQNRVLLLSAANGVDLDIALGAIPFEERAIQRASQWRIPSGTSLLTCSAEDLIVHKAFADRDIDWADVERILIRQGARLNLDLVWSELRPLIQLKEAPAIATRLEALIKRWPPDKKNR
ncbi:MAG: hypothetical protein M3463_18515 [Verrucomicrobiota bacterium]|nr:hypothetical protein [Verrucomicrobiota bacterium]